MPYELKMPALSPTMKQGNLIKWNKNVGDEIKSGDVIAEIETDKAIMEFEALDRGILGKILVPENTKNVEVGTAIALMLKKGESSESLNDYKMTNHNATEVHEKTKNTEESCFETHSNNNDSIVNGTLINNSNCERKLISPLAKRIANEKNIDLSQIIGSGPHNRIIKRDLDLVTKKENPSKKSTTSYGRLYPESNSVDISNIRSVIANRLTESKQSIPHFYLNASCNVDKLLSIRSEINSLSSDKNAYKISVNDIITKAVANAMELNPKMNASWNVKNIIQYSNIDVSIAVATDEGLITPIVQNANQKSLKTISSEIKSLVRKAKENALKPHEFQGGSITISNLGMYGTSSFSAIINPPQSCIVAVGAVEKKPIVDSIGSIIVANVINVTISVDHRVIDGAVAAEFLSTLKTYLENPGLML